MATAATLLALIDTAIEALITGGHESYSIGARSVTKLDLKDLFAERRILEQQVQRESGGTGAMHLAKIGRVSR
ncbi:MAG TPA: hypothetical protein VMX74_11640 [Pirellulales bacterium]|nr:hypothetical protein [Pirellulales bacterium]